ncbi:MAG: hypothetical protein ACI9LT_002174, partial [Pseudoalteromonas distincta]
MSGFRKRKGGVESAKEKAARVSPGGLGLRSGFEALDYSTILATTPAPTVRPPSRM